MDTKSIPYFSPMWSAQVNNRTHFGIFRPTKQVAIMLNCYCCIANMRMTAGALCNCNFSKSVCRGVKNTCRHSCRMANWAGDGDPMRLGTQVVSGIGFLSAGTIIVTQHNQRRLILYRLRQQNKDSRKNWIKSQEKGLRYVKM